MEIFPDLIGNGCHAGTCFCCEFCAVNFCLLLVLPFGEKPARQPKRFGVVFFISKLPLVPAYLMSFGVFRAGPTRRWTSRSRSSFSTRARSTPTRYSMQQETVRSFGTPVAARVGYHACLGVLYVRATMFPPRDMYVSSKRTFIRADLNIGVARWGIFFLLHCPVYLSSSYSEEATQIPSLGKPLARQTRGQRRVRFGKL